MRPRESELPLGGARARAAAGAGRSAIRWGTIDSFAGNFSSPALLAHRPCPICGVLAARVVTELRDVQFYGDSASVPKRVTVRDVQCLACFALYQNPCYSEFGLRALFAEAGRSYGASPGRADEQVAWLAARGLLPPGTAVLDVGCHEGRFLAALPAGVERRGVDVDAGAVEAGRREGLDLVCADLESFVMSAPPDTITMFHVLEHVPRPVGVLRRLRAVGHARTGLVVEVPILEKGTTADVNGFLSVQHVTHFSRGSLRNCLGQAGWRATEWCELPAHNGCRVVAEPAGDVDEVTRHPEDLAAVHEHLAWWYAALADLDRALAPVADAPRVAIWGAGMHAEMLYQRTALFHAAPERTYLLVDGDPAKVGRSWRGLAIHPPAVLASPDLAGVPVVISSYGSQEAIAAAAIEIGVPERRLVRLYRNVRVY